MIKLENWSTVYPYLDLDPEICHGVCIEGMVYGHPKKEDGKRVRTSAIHEVNGRIVKTRSGSVYGLGIPNPDWAEFMKRINKDFDPENPLNRVTDG